MSIVSVLYSRTLFTYFIYNSVLMGEGNGTPLQYSCLENPMDGGAWWAAVHGVAKIPTWLRDFSFPFHFHALEKEMQPTPVFLPGESQGRGEPAGLLSMGSHRVGHDWSNLAAAAAVCWCGFFNWLFKSLLLFLILFIHFVCAWLSPWSAGLSLRSTRLLWQSTVSGARELQ